MKYLAYALAALACYSSGALAGDALIIKAPKDGATLNGKAVNEVVYAVETGDGSMADHAHLTVDGGKPALLPLEGSYPIRALKPGKHQICITVTDSGHTPIGLERCLQIKAR